MLPVYMTLSYTIGGTNYMIILLSVASFFFVGTVSNSLCLVCFQNYGKIALIDCSLVEDSSSDIFHFDDSECEILIFYFLSLSFQ